MAQFLLIEGLYKGKKYEWEVKAEKGRWNSIPLTSHLNQPYDIIRVRIGDSFKGTILQYIYPLNSNTDREVKVVYKN